MSSQTKAHSVINTNYSSHIHIRIILVFTDRRDTLNQKTARSLVTYSTTCVHESYGRLTFCCHCNPQLRNFNDFISQLYFFLYRRRSIIIHLYTGCPRRNVPDFGRVFLILKYADITQNTYVQS
jgi:hypothetical protein